VKFADLHVHTIFSDGTSTPEELIFLSKKCGLSAISVVDHDTIQGVAQTLEIGREENVEVLPGIELSAEYDGLEIHILGYLIDYENGELLEKLSFLKRNRVERIYKIAKKLNDLGINLDPEDVFSLAGNGTVGRLHVARVLEEKGFVGSVYEAFRKYLGDNCPAYELGFRFSPKEAIKLIKDAKGIPVLAHPYILKKDDLIFKFIEQGIMGLEVHYIEHSQSMVNFYSNIAKENGLLITGGSDFHGGGKPGVKLGSIKVPYELVERLKVAREGLLK
jgi:3',5'-nucleoside bisphosphate phosphatase